MIIKKQGGAARRAKLKAEFWPNEEAWTGEREKGWFRFPRTLPLILSLLDSKRMSGNKEVSRVYVELLARHMDDGIIELGHEDDHAYAAGYEGGVLMA